MKRAVLLHVDLFRPNNQISIKLSILRGVQAKSRITRLSPPYSLTFYMRRELINFLRQIRSRSALRLLSRKLLHVKLLQAECFKKASIFTSGPGFKLVNNIWLLSNAGKV